MVLGARGKAPKLRDTIFVSGAPRYAALVGGLEEASRDNLDFLKDKALRALADLLRAKPEAEARLLAALVNKLGDPSRKLASKARPAAGLWPGSQVRGRPRRRCMGECIFPSGPCAFISGLLHLWPSTRLRCARHGGFYKACLSHASSSAAWLDCAVLWGCAEQRAAARAQAGYLLAGVLEAHPGMKLVAAREVERFLFRPGLAERARYFAVVFLNQLPLSHAPAHGAAPAARSAPVCRRHAGGPGVRLARP